MGDRNRFWNFVGTALATFVGVSGSIAVAYFTFLNADRGHDIRMVEISLSILRGEGDREMSLPARKYALKALQQFSGVTMEPEDERIWAATGITPFKPTNSNSLASYLSRVFECSNLEEEARLECDLREFERMNSAGSTLSRFERSVSGGQEKRPAD